MATTRPMTEAERRWLAARSPGDPGRGPLRRALWTEGFWALGLGWAALRLALPDILPPGGQLQVWELVWLALSALLALRWEKRRRMGYGALSRRRDRARRIAADLAQGEMAVRRLPVAALHRFAAPGCGGAIWLVRVAEYRACVLHDMDPNAPLRPCAELDVATAPQSGQERMGFAGAPVAHPPARALAGEPRVWPEDQSWTDEPDEALLDWLSGLSPPDARPASSETSR